MTELSAVTEPEPGPPDPGRPYPVPDPGVPYPAPDPGEPYPVPDPGDPDDDPEADRAGRLRPRRRLADRRRRRCPSRASAALSTGA
jgi:hypothetical protein